MAWRFGATGLFDGADIPWQRCLFPAATFVRQADVLQARPDFSPRALHHKQRLRIILCPRESVNEPNLLDRCAGDLKEAEARENHREAAGAADRDLEAIAASLSASGGRRAGGCPRGVTTRPQKSHGQMSSRPVVAKSAKFRVAKRLPLVRTMDAVIPSGAVMGRPCRSAALMMSP
jgi:hypothetical protein